MYLDILLKWHNVTFIAVCLIRRSPTVNHMLRVKKMAYELLIAYIKYS